MLKIQEHEKFHAFMWMTLTKEKRIFVWMYIEKKIIIAIGSAVHPHCHKVDSQRQVLLTARSCIHQ